MKKITINVSEIPDTRTDQFISDSLKESHPELTRSKLKNLLISNRIYLNSNLLTKFNHKLHIGDVIIIDIPEPENTDITPENIPLNIIYDDDDIIVINKQKDLQTHPGGGNYHNTLVNALLYHFAGRLSSIGGVIRPGIVHRLDRLTSGLIVVAKNDLAHLHISNQLKERSLKRTYLALCFGTLHRKFGSIETYLDKHPINRHLVRVTQNQGKIAITKYKVKTEFADNISLVECNLQTGRTHQIRVHLSHLGHSIVGDLEYGHNSNKIKNLKNTILKAELEKIHGQLLHAYRLELIHPTTNKLMSFEAEPTEEFQTILKILKEDIS